MLLLRPKVVVEAAARRLAEERELELPACPPAARSVGRQVARPARSGSKFNCSSARLGATHTFASRWPARTLSCSRPRISIGRAMAIARPSSQRRLELEPLVCRQLRQPTLSPWLESQAERVAGVQAHYLAHLALLLEWGESERRAGRASSSLARRNLPFRMRRIIWRRARSIEPSVCLV